MQYFLKQLLNCGGGKEDTNETHSENLKARILILESKQETE